MAGLTLAGAAALSHDLWVNVVRQRQGAGARAAARRPDRHVLLGILAILLGILFKGQNVAFMVGLAFAIAASANFPALLLSIFWRRFTTRGAVADHARHDLRAGADLPLADGPGRPARERGADLSAQEPGIISMPLAFLGAIISLLTRERSAEEKFIEAERQIHLGAAATPKPVPTEPVLPAQR